MTQWLVTETQRRPQLTHNQLVPGSSPGGTTNTPLLYGGVFSIDDLAKNLL